MRKTLELMKEIISGKEKNIEEINLIDEYQRKLSPNILAYFYCNNFGIISKTALNYPIISNEDKASFCLQELDKALKRYQLNSHAKFITYFIRCFKNRLRMETEQLLTQKRKICLYTDILEEDTLKYDFNLADIDLILSNYDLDAEEKEQCKLLQVGYSVKEIARIFKTSAITIYKRNARIKQKILNANINYA